MGAENLIGSLVLLFYSILQILLFHYIFHSK